MLVLGSCRVVLDVDGCRRLPGDRTLKKHQELISLERIELSSINKDSITLDQ